MKGGKRSTRRRQQRDSSTASSTASFTNGSSILSKFLWFFLGCLVSSLVLLNLQAIPHVLESTRATSSSSTSFGGSTASVLPPPPPSLLSKRQTQQTQNQQQVRRTDSTTPTTSTAETTTTTTTTTTANNHISSSFKPFSSLRVLVALVAYDFSQIPHLEQVLDAYSDLAVAVELVHVVIYTTVPWPVTYIDMMQTRYVHENFKILVQVWSPATKLHLVNEHRIYFYEHLQDYDLFIYSEDDILVSPTTVATYYQETMKLKYAAEGETTTTKKKSKTTTNSKLIPHQYPHDFNIGVVRYEYQYPIDIVIDDSTRHVTQNVSRIYWEHLKDPAYDHVDVNNHNVLLSQTLAANDGSGYVTMKNNHQGLYMATAELLHAWKDRCQFDIPSNRPGRKDKPSQPTEGTQRVWISSNQLLGKRHCNVLQLLPIDKFGALTVWHLPNKNYRRIGRKGRLGRYQSNVQATEDVGAITAAAAAAAGGTTTATTTASSTLPSTPQQTIPNAMKWHLGFQKTRIASQSTTTTSTTKKLVYTGCITMEDHVHGPGVNAPLLKRRMRDYFEYIERGGILSLDDMKHTELVEVA